MDAATYRGTGRRTRAHWRPARIVLRTLGGAAVVAALLFTAACGRSIEEPEVMARAELVPTFTALPPATATFTPLPQPTATVPYATPTPDQFQAAGLPIRLEIPAIRVDAAIEHVGLTDDYQMDVPKLARNVAWYKLGPLPGQVGNSVINGHLDQAAAPAVFFELRKVIPGDEMEITYENGDSYVFVINEKARYQVDQSPMGLILGDTNKRNLNLITCDGAWDRGEANYSQRLVIYSRLKTDLSASALSDLKLPGVSDPSSAGLAATSP